MSTPIFQSGRRMGKTTMAQKWAEENSATIVRPMTAEEFNQQYLTSYPTGGTIATTVNQPPITLEAIEKMKAEIERLNAVTIAGGIITSAHIGDGSMGILDSVAGAAAAPARNLKENDMDDTTKKQLEGIGAALMRRNAQEKPAPFGLAGPTQLTIKTRQGQYKKKAFLGDETFTLSSQYIGKKDMILVFKNTRPVDYAFMEIPLDEALVSMKDFKAFADAAGGGDIHTTLANIETIKTQEKRAERDELLADPEFASW